MVWFQEDQRVSGFFVEGTLFSAWLKGKRSFLCLAQRDTEIETIFVGPPILILWMVAKSISHQRSETQNNDGSPT